MAAINTANTNLAAAAAVKSPRNAGDGVGSPQSRRAARPGGSPWTQIVRGESEPIAAVPSSPSGSGSASAAAAVVEPVVAAGSSSSSSPPPSASTSPSPVEEMGGESSDNGSGTNGNAGKRPAWNKPSNGGVEIGPVMGAVSWPALSESTRVPSKSGSEPVKGLSDGSSSSVPLSQGSGVAVPTTTPTQKHLAPTLTPNHTGPLPSPSPRPRAMRRNNSNMSSNGGLSQQQAPASQVIEMAPNTPSPRDNTQRSGFGSQSHNSGDHPPHRNSFRHHRNNGPHPRGDGSHHHNYGGRRDQDRGNQDWNSHRSFNGRDTHMQSPRVGSRVYRPTPPSHTSGPYIPAHVVRPYGHIGFPEMGPQMFYIPSPPFVAPPAFYVPAPPDPQLSAKIVNQIEYYFSNDNLIKDTYLRKNMDDQGWVSIELIANFKKVKDLTEHIPLIVEALRMSSVLELQGEKVRKRDDWMRWPLTHGNSSQDMLAARVHGIALEETNNNTPQSSNQPRMPNGDGTGQYSVQAGSDRSFAGRN